MIINRKKRKKTSLTWIIPREELVGIVKKSKSMSDVLRHFKLCTSGGTANVMKLRILSDNIDCSHFNFGKGQANKGRTFNYSMSKEECLSIFRLNSPAHVTTIKKYIRKYDLIPYVCQECNLLPFWNNKPLSIQLDHKDGNNQNQELDNLRYLCPNCHSQTSNFSCKNKKVFRT